MRRTLRICRNAWTRYGNCPDRPLPVLPLFDDGGEVRDCYLPLCRRVQAPPVPAEQEQQRSGTERAASPGNGAVHRVWGTAPTSRNCGFRQRREPQFRAFVGTKALLARIVPNSVQYGLYREKYYTELAEERQTTPGLRLKKLGITNKSETH